jgi:DNA polymerase III alpha subunit
VTENRMRDLLNERDALGLMVSGSMLEGKNAKGEYHRLAELNKARGSLKVIGIVSKVKTIVTKAGTKMAFLTVYDEESEFEFTLFAEEYSNAYPYLKSGNAIAFLARKDGYRGLPERRHSLRTRRGWHSDLLKWYHHRNAEGWFISDGCRPEPRQR